MVFQSAVFAGTSPTVNWLLAIVRKGASFHHDASVTLVPLPPIKADEAIASSTTATRGACERTPSVEETFERHAIATKRMATPFLLGQHFTRSQEPCLRCLPAQAA